jgi:hypothetical protein
MVALTAPRRIAKAKSTPCLIEPETVLSPVEQRRRALAVIFDSLGVTAIITYLPGVITQGWSQAQPWLSTSVTPFALQLGCVAAVLSYALIVWWNGTLSYQGSRACALIMTSLILALSAAFTTGESFTPDQAVHYAAWVAFLAFMAWRIAAPLVAFGLLKLIAMHAAPPLFGANSRRP